MYRVVQKLKVSNDFSDLFDVDITSFVCFFIFCLICAFVFLQIVYDKYIKSSTLELTIINYFTDFNDDKEVKLAS